MAGNPLASLPGLPQRPSPARSSASETRLTQPGIEAARSRKLNPAPTAAFRFKELPVAPGGERASFGLLPRPVTDGDVSQLQEWLQHAGLPKIGRETTHQAVDQRAQERSFHPIRDYLGALAWDGTPRVER